MPIAGRRWAWAVPAAALLAGGCAGGGASRADVEPAPRFTRSWSPYTPEELSRDVVVCAEQARSGLGEDEAAASGSEQRRRALYQRTTACMEQRGWSRL